MLQGRMFFSRQKENLKETKAIMNECKQPEICSKINLHCAEQTTNENNFLGGKVETWTIEL